MLELFLTFLKIGAVSFGGGYGMISLLTEEVVLHGWLSESEVLNLIAVSESTPGPLAINMATFVGSSQFGLIGAFLATLGVVLPAFVIILIVASFIRGLLQFAGVKAFLNGVRPVVVGLIISTALTMFVSVTFGFKTIGSEIDFDFKALIIFAVIALTGILFKKIRGKNISPIALILISAVLGMLLYGLL